MHLQGLVTLFRHALESTDFSELEIMHLRTGNFPEGCCDEASLLLAAFLDDHGHTGAIKVYGSKDVGKDRPLKHTWLLLDGIMIDITADQFEGYANPKVICQENQEFLDSFEKNEKGLADFRIRSAKMDCDFLDEYHTCYEKLKCRIKELI